MTTQNSRNYTKLAEVPDMSKLLRGVVKDTLPVLGTKRSATGDPKAAFEVADFTVDREHLAAYARATGLRYSSELPITYPFVLSFPLFLQVMLAPDFPCRAAGMVHLTNEIEQTRPLRIDDELTLRVHAENLRPHRKGLLVDFISEISVDGELVWRQTSGFLGMGAKFSAQTPNEVRTRGEDSGSVLERLDVADETATVNWKVDRDIIDDYAEASGDKNPLHVSTIGAKAFGFPAPIAHGMWTAAKMVAGLEGELPGALRYTVEFQKPVILPARIAYYTFRGEGTQPGPATNTPATDAAATEAPATDTPATWNAQVTKGSDPKKVHAVGKFEALS